MSTEVRFRSNLGRFMAACTEAKTRSVQRCINLGATISEDLAPEESGELKESIVPVMLDAGYGVWVAMAKHAGVQEFGGPPHLIGGPGQILGNEDKGFGPVRGPVEHPGNDPQPYMRPAQKIVAKRQVGIMEEEYPG